MVGTRPRHFVLVVVAAVLWGGGGAVGKLLGDHADLHALSIALWRVTACGLALLAYLAVRRALHVRALTPAMWRRIAITGAFTAIFESMYFTAISLSSVGLATLIAIGSAPVLVAAYDLLFTHARPTRITVVALVIALVGMVLVLSGSIDAGRNALLGAVLAIATGASFAGITIVNRRPMPGLSPVLLTGGAFTFAALVLLPFAAMAGLNAPRDGLGWMWVVVLGVVTTALAYIAYFTGLATVPAFVATIVTLLEPLVAAVAGALLFAERLGPWAIVGGAALATAVVLLRPQRDAPKAPRVPPTMGD